MGFVDSLMHTTVITFSIFLCLLQIQQEVQLTNQQQILQILFTQPILHQVIQGLPELGGPGGYVPPQDGMPGGIVFAIFMVVVFKCLVPLQ